MDWNDKLFTIAKENHTPAKLRKILENHPEVAFVSVTAMDLGGHDTDEKIPIGLFLKDIRAFLENGVQTDGSAVVLPRIADLSNGRVDLIPDAKVNWYVDYDLMTGIGTLRIPAYLLHNGKKEVGTRYLLREAIETFREELRNVLTEHPYALQGSSVSPEDIEEIELTGATELEFWVQTPEDQANREQLSTSQELKEQYWQRTRGPVRTALEEAILYLNRYGIGVEMGHKEVGGIKAKLGASGHYDHIMEQLEIDWKYDSPMQAADNEILVRNVVKDIFRSHGLEVTFMAKPIIGVAGSGEHHHLGAALVLGDGTKVNLFHSFSSYLSPVGYGALMGLLKNYDAVNQFVACTNDALNRLKPGFEAPVCVVTSLGKDEQTPSRNRTVLVGLIRDLEKPDATRFELRAPSPHNNTYLVFASAYLAMLDGILAALLAEKGEEALEKSISKSFGEEDFYLERNRAYRSEKDVFAEYTEEERNHLFGKAPETVWETLRNAENSSCLLRCPAFTKEMLESYREAMLNQWAMELVHRLVPGYKDTIRRTKKCHESGNDRTYSDVLWDKVQALRVSLGQNTEIRKSLLTNLCEAVLAGDYRAASEMQKTASAYMTDLENAYHEYEQNLISL